MTITPDQARNLLDGAWQNLVDGRIASDMARTIAAMQVQWAVEYRLSPDTPWRPIAGLPVEGDDLMADHWIANERVARRRAEYAAEYGNQTRLVCRYITEEMEA